MEDKKIEDTVDNQLLTKEEIAEVESLGDKNEDELTPEQKANKKLYARMSEYKTKLETSKKESEEKITQLTKDLEESKKLNGDKINNTDKKEDKLDEIGLARKIKVLQEYDEEEIEFAQVLAKGANKDILEVIKMEQFKTFSEAKREKDKKANLSQTPNGRQGDSNKKDPMFEKFSQGLPKGFDFNQK
jgi:hypothetical protein